MDRRPHPVQGLSWGYRPRAQIARRDAGLRCGSGCLIQDGLIQSRVGRIHPERLISLLKVERHPGWSLVDAGDVREANWPVGRAGGDRADRGFRPDSGNRWRDCVIVRFKGSEGGRHRQTPEVWL
jgi:hypothetical protein